MKDFVLLSGDRVEFALVFSGALLSIAPVTQIKGSSAIQFNKKKSMC